MQAALIECLTDDTAKNFNATTFSYKVYQYSLDFKVQTNLLHIDIQIYDHALTLHFKIHAD